MMMKKKFAQDHSHATAPRNPGPPPVFRDRLAPAPQPLDFADQAPRRRRDRRPSAPAATRPRFEPLRRTPEVTS
jgi:hypothetical protein